MQTIGEAFLKARDRAAGAREQQSDQPESDEFARGVDWVRSVLVPAVQRGNRELQPHDVAIRLDLNLDPRCTNHAHADFWLAPLCVRAGAATGPRYSINVIGGRDVWLYKPGAPGRVLGTTESCGPEQIHALFCDAAAELGAMIPAG